METKIEKTITFKFNEDEAQLLLDHIDDQLDTLDEVTALHTLFYDMSLELSHTLND